MTARHLRLGSVGLRTVAALVTLSAGTVAGCADINPGPGGTQAAKYGILITWDTTQSGNTVTAENALVVQCGLPAPTTAVPVDGASVGVGSSYVAVPGGTLRDTVSSCLTNSKIVTNVDILSRPAPRSS